MGLIVHCGANASSTAPVENTMAVPRLKRVFPGDSDIYGRFKNKTQSDVHRIIIHYSQEGEETQVCVWGWMVKPDRGTFRKFPENDIKRQVYLVQKREIHAVLLVAHIFQELFENVPPYNIILFIFKSRREFCNLLQHRCTSITLCQLQKNSGALWFHWWVTRRVKFTEAEMRVVAARLPGLVKAAWVAGVSWGQSPFGKMKVLCRWLEVMVAQRSGFAQQRWAARRAGGKTAHWMSRMRQDNLKHHSESWTIQHAT